LQFIMGIVGLFFHILFLSPMRWIRQLLQIKDAVTCGLLNDGVSCSRLRVPPLVGFCSPREVKLSWGDGAKKLELGV